MSRKLVVALTLTGALATAAVATAAHSHSVSSKLTIKAKYDKVSGGYLISGKVRASKKACVKKRLVKLYLHIPQVKGYQVTAQALAKSNGTWAIAKNYPVRPGRYFAKVDKLKTGKTTCRSAKTKTIVGKTVKPVA